MSSDIKEYDVFVSYAHTDDSGNWVSEFVTHLKEKGTCFFDKYEIGPGDNFVLKINDAIEASRYLVLIVTKNVCNRSWPMREWSSFLAHDSLARRIIPVVLDGSEPPSLLRSIRAVIEPNAAAAALKVRKVIEAADPREGTISAIFDFLDRFRIERVLPTETANAEVPFFLGLPTRGALEQSLRKKKSRREEKNEMQLIRHPRLGEIETDLASEGVLVLEGDSGSGKTVAALQLGLRFIEPPPTAGREASASPGRCYYINVRHHRLEKLTPTELTVLNWLRDRDAMLILDDVFEDTSRDSGEEVVSLAQRWQASGPPAKGKLMLLDRAPSRIPGKKVKILARDVSKELVKTNVKELRAFSDDLWTLKFALLPRKSGRTMDWRSVAENVDRYVREIGASYRLPRIDDLYLLLAVFTDLDWGIPPFFLDAVCNRLHIGEDHVIKLVDAKLLVQQGRGELALPHRSLGTLVLRAAAHVKGFGPGVKAEYGIRHNGVWEDRLDELCVSILVSYVNARPDDAARVLSLVAAGVKYDLTVASRLAKEFRRELENQIQQGADFDKELDWYADIVTAASLTAVHGPAPKTAPDGQPIPRGPRPALNDEILCTPICGALVERWAALLNDLSRTDRSGAPRNHESVFRLAKALARMLVVRPIGSWTDDLLSSLLGYIASPATDLEQARTVCGEIVFCNRNLAEPLFDRLLTSDELLSKMRDNLKTAFGYPSAWLRECLYLAPRTWLEDETKRAAWMERWLPPLMARIGSRRHTRSKELELMMDDIVYALVRRTTEGLPNAVAEGVARDLEKRFGPRIHQALHRRLRERERLRQSPNGGKCHANVPNRSPPPRHPNGPQIHLDVPGDSVVAHVHTFHARVTSLPLNRAAWLVGLVVLPCTDDGPWWFQKPVAIDKAEDIVELRAQFGAADQDRVEQKFWITAMATQLPFHERLTLRDPRRWGACSPEKLVRRPAVRWAV